MSAANIYADLGVTPVINARGNQTVLGGSTPSGPVRAAMESADRYFVDMEELLRRTGKIAAELIGCEDAYITPGCAAAMALGMAACIAGDDEEKMAHLPDTTGMRRDMLVQTRHRYSYDRPPTIVGARRVEVGDARGTTAQQLAEAMGPDTAAVLFPAHLNDQEGTVPLTEVIQIAHEREIPVLVDAASQVYPVERLGSWTAQGADLVCFGAKYLGATNSSGLLCGRADLVASARRQGFIGFETGGRIAFGRPLKLDRQEIIAVTVALREWVTMDHEVRIQEVQRKVDTVARGLAGIEGATSSVLVGARFGAPALHIEIGPGTGKTAGDIAAALEQGNPSIRVGHDATALDLNLGTVADGDEEVIAARLRELLTP